MRQLLYVENTGEIDKRCIYVCLSCHGPVCYTKCGQDFYCWKCAKCEKEADIKDLKIQIGEHIADKRIV